MRIRSLLRCFVLVPALALVACGDDTAVTAGATPLIDFGELGTDGTLPADWCGVMPVATGTGSPCSAEFPCSNGAICAIPPGSAQGACAQACFPDGCPQECTGDQTCARVEGPDGTVVQVDLNADGTADQALGACQGPPAGTVAAFGACGSAGLCTADATCLTLEAGTEGTCLTTCDTSSQCEAFDSYPSRCSATTDRDLRVCLIACEPEAGAPCPAGLTCREAALGNYACFR